MVRADEKVIDHRRDSMVYGQENKSKRDQMIIAAGGKPPTTPFHWGQKQETTVALWPGAENSPALKPAADKKRGDVSRDKSQRPAYRMPGR